MGGNEREKHKEERSVSRCQEGNPKETAKTGPTAARSPPRCPFKRKLHPIGELKLDTVVLNTL